MPHLIDMVLDFQFGSTGKGLIAGYLAKRKSYDTAVCAFATNAGHTYIDAARGIHVMTQQLPTAITSDTVEHVLLGPGSAIHPQVLLDELERYSGYMKGKTLMIHPFAAVVTEEHAEFEIADGRTKMGSTAKGVGEAYIERIRRHTDGANVAVARFKSTPLEQYVVTQAEYTQALLDAEAVMIEGAQGFSLSMYHGFYPFTTSRDVTPWQVAADCGIPFSWASYIKILGTLRMFPIRVNNRNGSSGPPYPDQGELNWAHFPGVKPELTTVTKLPRRIFSFSRQQLAEAMIHCGGYWDTQVFLNFANYGTNEEVEQLITNIETPGWAALNAPRVAFVGFGPDDKDVVAR